MPGQEQMDADEALDRPLLTGLHVDDLPAPGRTPAARRRILDPVPHDEGPGRVGRRLACCIRRRLTAVAPAAGPPSVPGAVPQPITGPTVGARCLTSVAATSPRCRPAVPGARTMTLAMTPFGRRTWAERPAVQRSTPRRADVDLWR